MACDTERASDGGAAASGTAADGGAKIFCHALEVQCRGRLLEQRSNPPQAATVERHRHGVVANILRHMLQRDALPGGVVAQLEEMAVGGPELARHPSAMRSVKAA
jgi:hypothetical protein